MKKIINDYLTRGSIGFILAITPAAWYINGLTKSLFGPILSIALILMLITSIAIKWKLK